MRLAVRPGFEPGQKPPKGLVLPLHHRTSRPQISFGAAHCKGNSPAESKLTHAVEVRRVGGSERMRNGNDVAVAWNARSPGYIVPHDRVSKVARHFDGVVRAQHGSKTDLNVGA